MGKKRQRAARTPFLLRLPPHLLQHISGDRLILPISASNVAICRALLPYTRRALYRVIDLVRSGVAVKLGACTKYRPELLDLVKMVSYRTVSAVSTAAAGLNQAGEGDVSRLKQEQVQTLVDILYKMRNLESLIMCGKSAARELFVNPHYLAVQPWCHLRHLNLLTDHDEEWEECDVLLLPRLLALPALTSYVSSASLLAPDHLAPLPLTNLGPTTYLSARSLGITHLFLMTAFSELPLEYRNLFAACSNTLSELYLSCDSLPLACASALSVLPPSLTTLTLMVGQPCPNGVFHPYCTCVDSIFPFWPNLTTLVIRDNLLLDTSCLTSLQHLQHLSLGPHTAFLPSDLARLLPPTLPALQSLTASLCCCTSVCGVIDAYCTSAFFSPNSASRPLPSTAMRRPIEKLLTRAEHVGVLVEGNVRCAVGLYRAVKEHEQWCIEKAAATRKAA
ncbi:hypothetical protein JCM8097_003457 [Rhodosporidiobolus ruineniae]